MTSKRRPEPDADEMNARTDALNEYGQRFVPIDNREYPEDIERDFYAGWESHAAWIASRAGDARIARRRGAAERHNAVNESTRELAADAQAATIDLRRAGNPHGVLLHDAIVALRAELVEAHNRLATFVDAEEYANVLADSHEAQRMHAYWQQRAETAEARLAGVDSCAHTTASIRA